MTTRNGSSERVPSPPALEVRAAEIALNGSKLLDRLDLVVPPGAMTAILGPSGVGKTTLVRMLLGMQPPSSGQVLVDGIDWATIDRRARLAIRRRIAYVQQQPGLLNASTLHNVAVPLRWRGLSKAQAEETAMAGLADVGLERLSSKSALGLSGGERQRLCLARALATRPDVLLLDEFTNQQDPANEDVLESLVLRRHASGASLVVVSHGLDQVARFEQHDPGHLRIGLLIEGHLQVCFWNDLVRLAAEEAGPGPFLRRLRATPGAHSG